MHITFFVGNGFDINLGLKSKYVQFYPYFINHSSEDNMIRGWIVEDDKKWSDLEVELGNSLYKVNPDEKEKFIGDLLELQMLLLDYLEEEQNRITIEGNEDDIANEFVRSFSAITEGFSEEDLDSIVATKKMYTNENSFYSFITFNYTDTLDRLFKAGKKKKMVIDTHRGTDGEKKTLMGRICHIHGTIDEGMILGVNDPEQINNEDLRSDQEFLNAFVKKNLNESTGQRKMKYAEEIIKVSRIICLFGMSIGDTDKMWWERIVKWLKDNQNCKLIIFHRSSDEEKRQKRRNLPVAVNTVNNKLKEKFLKKGGLSSETEGYDEIAKRVIISYDVNIFDFGSCGILDTDKEKA